MKKRLIVLIIVAIFMATAPLMAKGNSNSGLSHNPGDIVLQIGVGWGYYGVYGIGVPPITVVGEYGITDNISVGGMIGYNNWGYSYGTYNITSHNIMLGVRGNWHFNDLIHVKNLDLYAGIALGAYVYVTTSNIAYYTGGTTAGFLWNFQVGARYYFTQNIGVWLELGYGYSVVSGGVVFKF